MKSFYECSFLKQKWEYVRTFSVFQEEIRLNLQINNNQYSFLKEQIEYKCNFIKNTFFDSSKPTIVICIKDDLNLLSITIKNLEINNIFNIANVLIVDDRPHNTDIENYVVEKSLNYLGIDNLKGFNFSMLNNIASKILYELGNKTVVFWNSDLWTPDNKTLPLLLSKHLECDSILSGTKLLYPPQEFSIDGSVDTKNIDIHFPSMQGGKWRNTIQFGGGFLRGIEPYHAYRFKSPNDPRVKFDGGSSMITGAFHIWCLEYFINIGGFNPSLSKNYQDNDVCLRLLENNIVPLYFGKETYLYHDESPTLIKQGKQDKQIFSDHILFHKIWDEKILSLF